MEEKRYQEIAEQGAALFPQIQALRRQLHRQPEQGWLEICTSALVAERLQALGYEVLVGDAVTADTRMGLPDQAVCDAAYERALAAGVSLALANRMRDGRTGVIGILHCGEGPVVALRFDMDALPLTESDDSERQAVREEYTSAQAGSMHACGHDGHTAIGLGVAEILATQRTQLHGTVKLIFQPAEEGARGAAAIVEKGHLNDVDALLAAHIQDRGDLDGDVIPGSCGAYATTKLDAHFHGRAAHAASAPEKGRNVMLAVAAAITNLYAIPRHSGGASRVNVGTVHAGSGRNIIADAADMTLEVRGETTAINAYMEDYARRILNASAAMHGCEVRIDKRGEAFSLTSDAALMERVRTVCTALPDVALSSRPEQHLNDSEDISYMMARVQAHGGQTTFMRLLTATSDVPHGCRFDFDEHVLQTGMSVFSAVTMDLLKEETAR